MLVERRLLLKALGATALSNLTLPELYAAGRALHAQTEQAGEHVFLSLGRTERKLVAEIAELILPETDTPGAASAGVDRFIDLLLAEWFTDEERRRFERGLSRLSRDGFAEMNDEARTRYLESLEEEAASSAPGPSPADAPFIAVMKWLTVYGFFTSEAASQLGLDFVAFHGTFEGCAPLRK